MMSPIETILLVSSLLYAAFIGWCFSGWRRLPEIASGINVSSTYYTVLIAARNEEENIASCLESLSGQTCPSAHYEVIVIDDDSTDGTAGRVQAFLSEHHGFPCRLLSLKSERDPAAPHKKRALEAGVQMAKGSFILTTDADCILPPRWLETIDAFRQKYQPVFLAAPVMMSGENSLLEKFQALEFAGLVGLGAGSFGNGKPMMCNGANLGYDKNAFMKSGGFGQSPTASGDDTQLMHSFAKRQEGPVLFLKSRNACVSTHGTKSADEFMQQRLRWSSKIPLHMSPATVFLASNAWVLHASLVAGMFFPSPVWAAAWLVKSTAEFIFLAALTDFFGKRSLLKYFPLAQLVYPFYITLTGLLALRGTYRWKGRKQSVHA